MSIQLSDHFTYKKLLRFTLPSIAMMIFTSIYGVVDGFFVSNFVGKTPFAAVNFIMPFLMILGAFGFMFGTGGSALISKTMGEGDLPKANRLFSMLVCISVSLGIVIAVFGIIFLRPAASLLGAEGELLDYCVLYGRIILAAIPAFMLQQEFQSFFITAERPQLGLYTTVIAGVANMILDALFIAVFKWGVAGAAIATAISQCIGGVIPILYFLRPNTSLLKLTKPSFDGKALLKTCTNGSSELMSNVSMSLVGMLYNIQLMKYAGENGVAAYGVLMYVCLIFIAAFIGYTIGTAPVIGYHYGAGNHDELKSLFKKSLVIIGVFSVGMLLLGEVLAKPLSVLFVGYDTDLLQLTLRGFAIFSFSFLFSGIAIYGSGFFTALNNGLISAVISFLRTLVFQVVAIIILPIVWGIDGIWVSIVAAEVMAAAVTILFWIANRNKYHY
ncbi:MAG: MATE family efflux transporter [Lachnospiraceae bacterium]|jgi:putative efflux protein, MATE family|nr:MATE family efflux transporter [Lachnospiraceae bacterium]